MQFRVSMFIPCALVASAFAAAANEPAQGPPPPEVTFIVTEGQTIPVSFDYVGVTEPSLTVEIRSRVQGFLETREFSEGALLEEGARLFTIDSKPFEADRDIARARVEQAQTRLKLAEQEMARLQSVELPGAIAESDLDRQLAAKADAAAMLSLAKAELEKAELELGYTTIDAPLTGYIGKALKDIGSLVDANQNSLLATMRQVDPIYVSFEMSERDYLALRRDEASGALVSENGDGQYVEMTLLDGVTYNARGDLNFESAELDVTTGTVEFRGTFPNPERVLKPGQFVRAHLKGYARPGAILVPQRAVGQSPRGTYVYVLDQNNKAEFRIVKAGAWHENDWIIEEGLKPGERVVVDGIIKVQPGTVVSPTPLNGEPTAPAQS